MTDMNFLDDDIPPIGEGGPAPNGRDASASRRAVEIIRYADMHPLLGGNTLVKNILYREQTSIVFGPSGCGKTFLVLDLALHKAAAELWFDRKTIPGGVVYIAAEAGRGIQNRVAAWRLTYNRNDLPFAAVVSTIDLCHADSGDLDRLLAEIRALAIDPVLVIIDTVSRAMGGGNENAPDDMGAFVGSLDRIRNELHCHVMGVHHTGKDTARGARGHNLLHCAVDTEIEVTRDETTQTSTATITKQRDGEAGAQIPFRLHQVILGHDEDDDPVTSCIIEPAPQAVAKTQEKKLSAATGRALQLLVRAIETAGETIPASNHTPSNTKGVNENLWRDYCSKGGISTGRDNAKRMAFNRAAETLIAAGRVEKWGEWIWIK